MSASTRLVAVLRSLPERRGPIASCWTVPGARAAVTVTCTDPAVAHAVERLAVHTWLATGPSAGWRVDAIDADAGVLDAAGFAFAGAPAVHGTGAGPGQPPLRYLRAGTQALFWIDQDRVLIHADPRGVVRVITSSRASALAWVPSVARQVMTLQLLLGGAVHAHAAAVVVRGVGVLIAGSRATGKTSAALAAVRLLDADLVAADRILLSSHIPAPDPASSGSARPVPSAGRSVWSPGGPPMVGLRWPAPITVRSVTLAAYPELARALAGQRAERLDDLAPRPSSGQPHPEHLVTVEPEQAAVLLAGGRLRDRLTPRLLLMPRLALHLRPATVRVPERVAPDELHAELIETDLFLRDPATRTAVDTETWLTHPDQPTWAGNRGSPQHSRRDDAGDGAGDGPGDGQRGQRPAGIRSVARALAGLPCHRLEITRDPDGIARQIDALLPAGPARWPL